MALLPRSHEWYLCLARGKPFPFFQADAEDKILESKRTPHYPISRVNSMHRTNLRGVNFSSSVSKMCKQCVIGSLVFSSLLLTTACTHNYMLFQSPPPPQNTQIYVHSHT